MRWRQLHKGNYFPDSDRTCLDGRPEAGPGVRVSPKVSLWLNPSSHDGFSPKHFVNHRIHNRLLPLSMQL
jgi:hypothetical protein